MKLHGILLVNEGTGITCSLGYPQAAIWDVITRGYAYEQAVQMLTAITSLHVEEVKKLLFESLAAWVNAGFLILRKDYGESLYHNGMQPDV